MADSPNTESLASVQLPRVIIKFCVQCRWMLRAAYFAQELLSTFSTSLGEVSLVPSTGGIFTIDILHASPTSSAESGNSDVEPSAPSIETQTTRLWDRKAEGGFPEVKHLKQLVRNIIDPSRDLGHSDRPSKPPSTSTSSNNPPTPTATSTTGSDPLPKPSQNIEVEDPKATVPQGLHIAPDPTPKSGSGSAVPKDEKIVSDDSASRKETVTVTDTDAGIVKDVGDAKRDGDA